MTDWMPHTGSDWGCAITLAAVALIFAKWIVWDVIARWRAQARWQRAYDALSPEEKAEWDIGIDYSGYW